VNKDLFTNSVIQKMSKISISKPKVTHNPCDSSQALKMAEEQAMNTKEKEAKANETPIVKSLFDIKGNSKHKLDATANFGQPTGFTNPFGGGTGSQFKNPFAAANDTATFQNPF